jgi:hypothetical protein
MTKNLTKNNLMEEDILWLTVSERCPSITAKRVGQSRETPIVVARK